jgi:hypothetical protein
METDYDRECRKKYYEIQGTEPRHAGYSPSQLVSVMVVMECDSTEAKRLIDAEYGGLDWSEATWEETRDYFMEVKELV